MTTLYCIVDQEPPDTRELFRASCLERGLGFQTIRAGSVDFSEPSPAKRGDLLYRSATSTLAHQAAAHIWIEGMRALREPDGGQCAERSITIPSVLCPGRDRGLMRRAVAAVGGLPVVVKVPGGEGGVGVMLVESWPALVSLLDYLAATGVTPHISRFIADAEHWRCITLEASVIASYLNDRVADDFRTIAPSERSAYERRAPDEVLAAARLAAQKSGTEFAGVDVLVGRDNEPFVIEVNAPCSFVQAQVIGGIDISGAIIDHLLAKTAN